MHSQSQPCHIDVIRGDIADQPGIAAVVNAANAQLRSGGGVAGAIHKAAGPGLEEECRRLAPIRPGEAVITSAHNLPNHYVIHCLGPVYGRDKPEDKLLANCYRNALILADSKKADSVAFPAISTGVFGYPLQEAAAIAMDTLYEEAPKLQYVCLVRMVLFSEQDLQVFKELIR